MVPQAREAEADAEGADDDSDEDSDENKGKVPVKSKGKSRRKASEKPEVGGVAVSCWLPRTVTLSLLWGSFPFMRSL